MRQMRAIMVAVAFVAALAGITPARAETELKIFVGGQQRPDVMRALLDRYRQLKPDVRVEVEVGGATSELQQQYLTTVLTAKDSAIDVFLIDVVRPAQYSAAGWAEPLDALIGPGKDELVGQYLPVYADADQIDGKLVAVPAFADALFLYYRKDLLDKHGLQPPTSWDELQNQAAKVLAAENNPILQGFSVAGRAIEGTVCTFLVPYWGAGGSAFGGGRYQLDEAAARRSMDLWLGMKAKGLVKPGIAEVGTDDVRKEFQAGNVVFSMLWAYAWNHFETGADSAVKGKVGVTRLPAFSGGEPATCIGGWQWAVSSFSKNKPAALDLVRFLAGPEGVKHLAINASNLPVRAGIYSDPEVLAANAWFKDALPVLQTARTRPKTPRYPEVSEAIRTNMNAVLAGVKSPDAAIADMGARLGRALR